MAKTTIPDRLMRQIERIAEEEDMTHDEAVREVVSAGVTALRTNGTNDEINEIDDPYDTGGHEDEYMF